ncbi:DNA polymerase III [Metamycoplasma gateae]|uniref:DNA polymerase III n=1 Tax=Metamycoplasma gateae TaxID=35769 RepID=A0ABZ2AG57_9BACT|nr:DNA polymerase III [Metamycoplasma gateae]
MNNLVFKNVIDNSLKENKLNQVYLISSKNIKNFDAYFLYFINSINNEKFENFNQIKFGELYFYINGNDDTIGKQEVLDAISSTTETSIFSKNKKKILIINKVENGTQQSLNSLLKFLENPPHNTLILMSSNYIAQVLKTVKSRAFIIEINELKTTDQTKEKPFEKFFLKNNIEYEEQYIEIFENIVNCIYLSYKQIDSLLELIISNLSFENNQVLLNFLIFCYLDIYKLKKGLKDLVILDIKKINKEKFDYIPIFKIIDLLKEIKENLDYGLNFNLQKSSLLLRLEELYGL